MKPSRLLQKISNFKFFSHRYLVFKKKVEWIDNKLPICSDNNEDLLINDNRGNS
jgi:hypothetical protein